MSQPLAARLMSWFSDAVDAVADSVSEAGSQISNAASEFAEDVQDTVEDFVDDLGDTWSDSLDTASNAFSNGNWVQGILATFGGVPAGVLGTIGVFSNGVLSFSADFLLFTGTLGGILTGGLSRLGVIVITGGFGAGTARDLGRFISEYSRLFLEWGADGLRLSGDLLERGIDISAGILLAGTDFVRCIVGSVGRPGYAGYKPEGFHAINHFFVVMLENRSFDHMLGLLPGVEGLSGKNISNFYHPGGALQLRECRAGRDASFSLVVDPPHEFPDVHEQLFWDHTKNPTFESTVNNPSNAGVPTMGGFAMQYYIEISRRFSEIASRNPVNDPQEAMNTFTPERVPILSTLATEFAVCDAWHSSLPGPTLPNRQFVHAATSGGMADSPSTESLLWAMSLGGFEYQNGTIFDRLDANCLKWRIYAGDETPLIYTLKGMATDSAPIAWSDRVRSIVDLVRDLSSADGDFPNYIFIEPNYGRFWSDFKGGNSQHPLDSTVGGETLLKIIYESLRHSRIWESSALIITYDEHGGFHDHVKPPEASPPGDSRDYQSWSISPMAQAFQFDRLGVRVPAVVVSPWIERGKVDHDTHDHSSVIATLTKRFGLRPLTERDKNAKPLDGLFTTTFRSNCIEKLPGPVG